MTTFLEVAKRTAILLAGVAVFFLLFRLADRHGFGLHAMCLALIGAVALQSYIGVLRERERATRSQQS